MPTIQDYAKRYGHVAIFGDQITSPRLDDISVQFQYNIATKDIRSGGSVTGSGTVAHDGTNMMRVRAGTGAAIGTALAESVDVVRYRTGHDVYAMFTCSWSAPAAGGKQYIGLFDSTDGFALGYNGTDFGWLYRRASVDIFSPDVSFSHNTLRADSFSDGNGFVLDPLTINLFRLNFGYLGIAPVIWEVFSGLGYGTWLPFHIEEYHNKRATTHLTNACLPIACYVSSTGNAVLDINTPSWNAGVVINRQDEKADRFQTIRNSKTGISTETSIFSAKNVATFQSKTNRVVTELTYISASSDGAKNVTIFLKKNTALGGVPSYADIDAVNSIIQKDTAGTTVTGGEIVYALELGKVDSRTLDITNLHIRLQPGETLTASATSASASDISITLGERELF